MEKKLYCITRNDLPIGDQAVQCGHAVAEWVLRHGNWSSKILVFLKVKNLDELKILLERLRIRLLTYEYVREPDLNDELTAIVCLTDYPYFAGIKKLGE